jgi:MerR family transcriptional regulator, light-induced transcriptional regulator
MNPLVHASDRAVKIDVLSTRQVAQLLGVGEATVKRWADAGEIDCFRTPGGHRKFRLRDATAFVQKRHFAVTDGLPAELAPGVEEAGAEAVATVEKLALAGNASGLVAQIAALRLRGHELSAIFDDVIAPALVRIGERWQACKLTVAEEHIATQAVIDAIARVQPLAEPPGEPNRADRGTAVVAAVAGEQHDVAARMAACLLRARNRAQVVALASTVPTDAPGLQEQIEVTARAARSAGGRVVVGGKGMSQITVPEEVLLLGSMRDLDQQMGALGRRRSAAP